VFAGKSQSGFHILGVLTPDDEHRVAIDRAVPDSPVLVIAAVARPEYLAPN
jgi:hypothetical protein